MNTNRNGNQAVSNDEFQPVDTDTLELLESALDYAQLGFRVLPLHTPVGKQCSCRNPECKKSIGKHPRTAHGVNDATCNEATIRGWWKKWLDANVGIACDDIVILDIDERNGGIDSLVQLIGGDDSLLKTVRVISGNGFHLWFNANGTAVNNRTGVLPGIDVKSTGSYVVAPPSLHKSGKRYAWDRDAPLEMVTIPDQLATFINSGGTKVDSKNRFDTASALKGVPEGKRDETMYRLSRTLRRAGVPVDEALKLVLQAAQNCTPPFSEEEAQAKVERAYVELPKINAADPDLERVTQVSLNALIEQNIPEFLFLHGGPVRIEHDDSGAPIIRELTVDRVRNELARCAQFEVLKKDKPNPLPAHPPIAVCKNILATPDLPFPALTRIVEVPVFAADGRLQTEPGYSSSSRLYYAPDPDFQMRNLPERPTTDDVRRARHLIDTELLGDFPFVSPDEKINAIALYELPYARELINGPTPLHLMEKPLHGTGATLLADAISYPATGHSISAMTRRA